jgi:uncharacterized spore protein YtfJ
MSDVSSVEPRRPIAERVADGLARIVDVSARRVYDDPVQVGDRIIIPAATVESAGGFGNGFDTDGNGGGSGGGYGNGRPVAVIEAGPDGVHVRPVLDLTKIGLTALAAALAVWRATTVGRSRPNRGAWRR